MKPNLDEFDEWTIYKDDCTRGTNEKQTYKKYFKKKHYDIVRAYLNNDKIEIEELELITPSSTGWISTTNFIETYNPNLEYQLKNKTTNKYKEIRGMKHIEEWIEERIYGECKEDEKYAVAFFFLKGMDATSEQAVEPIMKHHKLFCTFENTRYRVTGCSRLGDIWLHTNFNADHGYTKRVDVEKCSNWSNTETL